MKNEKGSDVYTVDEIQAKLGINRNKAYELAMSGRFPAKKLGKRILIPKRILMSDYMKINKNIIELIEAVNE